jgi:hypothetical protein
MHGFGGEIRAENAAEGTIFTLEFLRATAVAMASHEPTAVAFNQAN